MNFVRELPRPKLRGIERHDSDLWRKVDAANHGSLWYSGTRHTKLSMLGQNSEFDKMTSADRNFRDDSGLLKMKRLGNDKVRRARAATLSQQSLLDYQFLELTLFYRAHGAAGSAHA